MIINLILTAVVIIVCILFNKISGKLGIPMLLAFIVLGMFFGSDGIVKIPFDDYHFASEICSIALIFIMFYGGFGTKGSEARPVAARAVLLSSAGTVMTAGFVGLFCHYILKVDLYESFLIGAVISSTDAASVFAILRLKRLNLRYNTASLLEVESGSNDPFSYMLTVIMLALMNGNITGGQFAYMIFAQVVYGAIFGVVIAMVALRLLKRLKTLAPGFDAVFIVAVALISYALPAFFGGNGYLSAYITGIIIGNSKIENKQALVHFFDGMTGLMQMLLFFLLGLLSFPSHLPLVAFKAMCVALFLTFVARPVAVFGILTPFKSKIKQQLLVSWSGLRGAASIVFAIMAYIDPATTDNDIFHMVFFIVLFSILIQGTLIPVIAKKLNMTDDESDVMKTFNDYMDEIPTQFIQFTLTAPHPWIGQTVNSITLPPDSILVLLIRNKANVAPNGNTVLCEGDALILSGKAPDIISGVQLHEVIIESGDVWDNRSIAEIPSGETLIFMIKRGRDVIIPKGDVILTKGDVVIVGDVKD